MLTKDTILSILQNHKPQFSKELGVKRIGLFGSYAKGLAKPESDVDILIDMPPNSTNLCTVWDILEAQFNTKVDLLRTGPHVGKAFLKKIEAEIIYAK